MELFENIRLRVGKAILSKKMARSGRKVNFSDIKLVKRIGIVWDASRLEDFASVSRFHQKMHERNIEVKVLGYFPGKSLPDQYTAIRYLTCIRQDEINYIYHPVSTEVNSFINSRYEVLIDINFNRVFPLLCISSLSDAGFKVGLFTDEASNVPFDLMMEMKQPVSIENYLNQVILYLEMISSGADKKDDK